MSSCHNAYFPSMLCEQVTNVKIVKHGNTFNRFYRFPNPEFVYNNELDATAYEANADNIIWRNYAKAYKKSHEQAPCTMAQEDDVSNANRFAECSTTTTCTTNADCENAWESCAVMPDTTS